jgi:hypothetical protein
VERSLWNTLSRLKASGTHWKVRWANASAVARISTRLKKNDGARIATPSHHEVVPDHPVRAHRRRCDRRLRQECRRLPYATALLSVSLLIVNSYVKELKPGQDAQLHREAASDIWNIRQSYLSLLTERRVVPATGEAHEQSYRLLSSKGFDDRLRYSLELRTWTFRSHALSAGAGPFEQY